MENVFRSRMFYKWNFFDNSRINGYFGTIFGRKFWKKVTLKSTLPNLYFQRFSFLMLNKSARKNFKVPNFPIIAESGLSLLTHIIAYYAILTVANNASLNSMRQNKLNTLQIQ